VRPKLPDYGTFTHWPEDGHARLHPDDIAIINRVIPSSRVFRRSRFDGVFYQFEYGKSLQFRLRPCMWLALDWEGIDVGDQVEVIGLGMTRDLFVARVVEMRFNRRNRQIEYTLSQAGQVHPRLYLANELRNLDNQPKLRKPQAGG